MRPSCTPPNRRLLFFSKAAFLHVYRYSNFPPWNDHSPHCLRRRLKLDQKDYSILLVEERPDGIFLHPTVTVPVRDIPASTIKKWVKNDEAGAASVKVLKR